VHCYRSPPDAAIVPDHPHAEQCRGSSPAACGPVVGAVDELPAAQAMTTQMSPLFQAMSRSVKTLAVNEMAARASMNTPTLIPTSTAKAAKRDAKPAHFPSRVFWMTIGVSGRGIFRARRLLPAPGASRMPRVVAILISWNHLTGRARPAGA
jgi:hypothetical protein